LVREQFCGFTGFSDYEQALIIHDLNIPLGRDTPQFDTVIDGGTTEHAFEVNTALANARALCSQGGMIIHILPANNFCGHGFWQFWSELFWNLYTEKNGFRDTEIFLAKLNDKKHWFRVNALAHAGRANIFSDNRIYLLVKTVKADDVSAEFVGPQQVDYAELWANNKDRAEQERQLNDKVVQRLRVWISGNPTLRNWRNTLFNKRAPFSMRINRFNPCLEPVLISKVISKSSLSDRPKEV